MDALETLKILHLIENKPHCVSDDIKELFKITPSNPPNKEEKRIYLLIRSLEKKDLIRKVPISNMKPGGSHFTLGLTSMGQNILEEVVELLCRRIMIKKSAKYTSESKRGIVDSSDEIIIVINDLVQNILQEFSLDLEQKERDIIKQLCDEALGKIQKIILSNLE